MRGLFVLVSFLVTLAMSAQNYFVDGMKWYSEVSGTHDPSATPHVEVVSIEKSDESNCFMMYREYQDEASERLFIAYINVDGDKVSFRLPYENQPEWYLLYDFGLAPGEGCYVYNPGTANANQTPRGTYIRCTGMNSTDFGDLNGMIMEEFADETCTEHLGSGIWLKGLSSLNGVLHNNYFEADGVSGKLLNIYNNDVLIYTSDTSSIAEVADSSVADIKVEGGYLTVSTDKVVKGSLYTQSGVHIGDYTFNKPSSSIQLPGSGLYILSLDGVAKKVLVP